MLFMFVFNVLSPVVGKGSPLLFNSVVFNGQCCTPLLYIDVSTLYYLAVVPRCVCVRPCFVFCTVVLWYIKGLKFQIWRKYLTSKGTEPTTF